ncbi:DUF3265 domain-containing protein [Neptunomonas concharum]|uniref:DUF3265 domain-containing protein n=1 Tax=Neptunomonas concharum TaxID=1031538 RepID=A0A5P1RGR9_9GAMM|nr:DUF3265 domain-containing protein [Neptunomonas concharum]
MQHAWHFWFRSNAVIKMFQLSYVVACFTP